MALVNPLSYASTVAPDIHILGDSQGTGQPKSGHMANAQAKVCADAIIRAFNGEAPDPIRLRVPLVTVPSLRSIAAWLTASYQYDPVSGTMTRVNARLWRPPQPTSDGMQQMIHWANNIFADSFA